MVQTLAALLSWIAMLALISIAVLVSGVWRPRDRSSSSALRAPHLPDLDPPRSAAGARSGAQRSQRAA